jgi:hypothetical protein
VSLAFALGLVTSYALQQLVAAPPELAASVPACGGAAAAQLRAPADRFHRAPCPGPRKPGAQRRSVVFAAVGDGWTPDK